MTKDYTEKTPEERANYWARVAIGGMQNVHDVIQTFIMKQVREAYHQGVRDGRRAGWEDGRKEDDSK